MVGCVLLAVGRHSQAARQGQTRQSARKAVIALLDGVLVTGDAARWGISRSSSRVPRRGGKLLPWRAQADGVRPRARRVRDARARGDNVDESCALAIGAREGYARRGGNGAAHENIDRAAANHRQRSRHRRGRRARRVRAGRAVAVQHRAHGSPRRAIARLWRAPFRCRTTGMSIPRSPSACRFPRLTRARRATEYMASHTERFACSETEAAWAAHRLAPLTAAGGDELAASRRRGVSLRDPRRYVREELLPVATGGRQQGPAAPPATVPAAATKAEQDHLVPPPPRRRRGARRCRVAPRTRAHPR